jgi:hypothetical protein
VKARSRENRHTWVLRRVLAIRQIESREFWNAGRNATIRCERLLQARGIGASASGHISQPSHPVIALRQANASC